jgi:tetratricopeptide (TPR) repeat protein
VKMFLSAIEPGIIPTQGTAIGAAVNMAKKAFDGGAGVNEEKSRAAQIQQTQNTPERSNALIIISDGENHEDDAVGAATKLAETGAVVHTIGMGSPEGAPIPVYASAQEGGLASGYRKDRAGNVIVTKLDEAGLQKVASAGGGIYVRATNTEAGLNIILDEIGKMQKKEFGTKIFTNYEDRFQYPLFAAFLLLLLEFFLAERRTRWLTRLNLFNSSAADSSPKTPKGEQTKTNAVKASKTVTIESLPMLVLGSLCFANLLIASNDAHAQTVELPKSARSLARDGNTLYYAGRFEDAASKYSSAFETDKKLKESVFNIGDALYKQGKFDAAADQFRLLTAYKDLDKTTLAKTHHNLGNTLLKQQKYAEAIESYKRALRLNASDEDTRHNLAYTQMQLQQQQKQQQNKNQKQDQQKQDQQKQDQQKQDQQKQDQQKQDQQKQDQQKQDQQKQDQQSQMQPSGAQQKPNLSKADAERMLEALNNQEKDVQKKLVRKRAVPVVIEKDW